MCSCRLWKYAAFHVYIQPQKPKGFFPLLNIMLSNNIITFSFANVNECILPKPFLQAVGDISVLPVHK